MPGHFVVLPLKLQQQQQQQQQQFSSCFII